MNLTLIAYATAAALTFGTGFGTCAVWKNVQISKIQLEQANERITSQRAARAEAEQRIATQRAAEVKAQSEIRAVVVDRADLGLLGSGLRNATAAVRADHESGTTCDQQVKTLTVISDQCSERYESVAADAQEWYIEAVKQNQAAQ